MIRTWTRHLAPARSRGLLFVVRDAFCIERSGYLSKFHRALCLPRKVTLRHHQMLHLPRKFTLRHHQMLPLPRKMTLQLLQILRLPRKMTLMIGPAHIWNVIYNARSSKSHLPTSPNTAPATQNDSRDWPCSHTKRHLPVVPHEAVVEVSRI